MIMLAVMCGNECVWFGEFPIDLIPQKGEKISVHSLSYIVEESYCEFKTDDGDYFGHVLVVAQ